MQKFKIGDIVTLKSGGPQMIVQGYKKPLNLSSLIEGKESNRNQLAVEVICKWFDGKTNKTAIYHEDLLQAVSQ